MRPRVFYFNRQLLANKSKKTDILKTIGILPRPKTHNMKRFILSALAVAYFGFSGFAQMEYVTALSGHQEVPSTTTQAEGVVEMTLRGDSLDVSGDIDALSSPIDFSIVGGAHIHSGYIGQNGPLVLPIRVTQDPDDLSAEFVDTTYFVGDIPNFQTLLDNGQAYVNVHTLDWASGEVRGQIVNVTGERVEDVFDAMLYGDQQNSPVLTDGVGGIMVVIDDQDMMTVTGSFSLDSDLAPIGGTGVHLHFGFHGQNGGIALVLNPTMDGSNRDWVLEASNNTFPVVDSLVDAMFERRIYINVHSEEFPSGEIRGQLVGFNNNVYFSYVSYDNPTPFPIAQSVMRVMAEKVLLEDSLTTSGSYSGWNANLLAVPLIPFVEIVDPFTGQIGVQLLSMDDVRSTNGTSGVIRATTDFANDATQVGLKERFRSRAGWITAGLTAIAFDSYFYHECKRAFRSSFTGSQAVPSTKSGGFGEIITEYYTSRIESNGIVRGLSGPIDVNIAGGMHIHNGFAGQTGGIEETITFQQASTFAAIIPLQNTKFITPVQASAMKLGGLYYNIHTEDYPAGEVRGQVLPLSNVMLHGIMSAGQAVPGDGFSLANGAVMGELYGDKVVWSGSFNDLGGFDPNIAGGAHIHGNTAGRTGGILQPLVSGGSVGATEGSFFRQNNIQPVSNSLIDSLILRFAYANIHSQAVPSGELRGQIGPLANNVAHAVLGPDVTVPYTGMLGMSMGTGHLHGEVYDTTLIVSGSWTDLSSAVDTAIVGGAHLHNGTVGQTGGILTPLNILLDSAQTAAVLNPVVNRYALTPTQVDQLLDGGIYANVHTLDAQSGAIRGQMLMSENQYPDASPAFRFPADGAMVDLGSADGTTVAAIDWISGEEFDPEQEAASFWQLFADTAMAPVFQSTVSDSSGISFTFDEIDALLASLGADRGEVVTVYHRAATTDGSLITYGDLSEVTFTRRLMSGLNELPEGAARLVNTLNATGGALLLDVDGLDAGQLTYQITGMNGNVIAEQQLQHAGFAQRYELPSSISQTGMYVLSLRDAQGRMSSWMFVVK